VVLGGTAGGQGVAVPGRYGVVVAAGIDGGRHAPHWPTNGE
jgi:hypothetical protein